MAFDPLGLGVVGGLLMQLLDSWHLPALLGDLDAIGQEDPGSADLEGLGRDAPDSRGFKELLPVFRAALVNDDQEA